MAHLLAGQRYHLPSYRQDTREKNIPYWGDLLTFAIAYDLQRGKVTSNGRVDMVSICVEGGEHLASVASFAKILIVGFQPL
jgi:hypothetical protein